MLEFIKTGKVNINIHDFVMYALFVLSFFNSYLYLAWIVIVPLALVLTGKSKGALDALIFITCRGVLNLGIVSSLPENMSLVRWAIIFALSIYLLACKTNLQNLPFFHTNLRIVLFAIYAIFAAWIVSSYPVTASFKVISYVVPFLAIIKGVSNTKDINWIKKISNLIGFLLIVGIPLFVLPVGYLRNGNSFQGLFNHPNMMGIMVALFIGVFLAKEKIFSLKSLIVVIGCIILEYFSKSRTGMFTILLIWILFIVTQQIKLSRKIEMILLIVLLVGVLIIFFDSFTSILTGFIYKGNNEGILISRETQIEKNILRFQESPIFGTGFNVPYLYGYRSYSFSFDLVTENGNLILAVLADTGLIGVFFWLLAYGTIFWIGQKEQLILFFTPIIVSFGEMAFFSTNSIAILFYFFFAIYIANGKMENGVET